MDAENNQVEVKNKANKFLQLAQQLYDQKLKERDIISREFDYLTNALSRGKIPVTGDKYGAIASQWYTLYKDVAELNKLLTEIANDSSGNMGGENNKDEFKKKANKCLQYAQQLYDQKVEERERISKKFNNLYNAIARGKLVTQEKFDIIDSEWNYFDKDVDEYKTLLTELAKLQ